jgi:hypothetical protein
MVGRSRFGGRRGLGGVSQLWGDGALQEQLPLPQAQQLRSEQAAGSREGGHQGSVKGLLYVWRTGSSGGTMRQ